ncbi:uncharacterized protein [Onthophagus taurus]|uniref:uncharacterized protein isoform X3 n=1 Tax=Onthophagus taurus TaxID=166361 RepID=UPI0039BDCF9A
MSLHVFVRALILLSAVVSSHKNRETPNKKMYFAIAATPSEQSYSRAFNKTLMNITQGIVVNGRCNVSVDTLMVELPENGSFSANLLQKLCDKFEGKHVIAVLVLSHSPAAQTVSLAATYSGIPVLWASGYGGFLSEFRNMDLNPLEVHLAPTGREMVQALRGLLLQAHWHTFTLLADSTSTSALQRPELWGPVSESPLHPTLISLPSPLRAQIIFRKLADMSRSTRGVIVLLGDRSTAGRILDYARRLNMIDGHFVWLWINTSNNAKNRNTTLFEDLEDHDKEFGLEHSESSSSRPKRDIRREAISEELSDLHFGNLLKRERYLLFNKDQRLRGFDNSKYKGSRISHGSVNVVVDVINRTGGKVMLPQGLLRLRPLAVKVDRHLVKGAAKLLVATLKNVLSGCPSWLDDGLKSFQLSTSCWKSLGSIEQNFSTYFARELKAACTDALAGKRYSQDIGVDKVDKSLVSNFEILNLVSEPSQKDIDGGINKTQESTEPGGLKWKRVGIVSGRSVRLDTIVWPGGDISVAAVSTRARTVFRIVTALAPPFVMESELDEDGQCLRGLPCHRVLTSDKDNLTLVFNEMEYKHRLEEEEGEVDDSVSQEYDDERMYPFQKFKYRTNCCYGLSMDLLENVAQELEFDFRLYIVADGYFGSRIITKKHSRRVKRDVGKKFLSGLKQGNEGMNYAESYQDEELNNEIAIKWNGIVGDLVSGAAHMSFAPLSVSSIRSEVIDFSVPYFYSGVSLLAAPRQESEIPLMAFLLPFSPELWIAIFTSLNITAIAVAIYEWLSPFGLNPWGRQRSKNFSMSSALWVMWGLLCGHLVAFKAPKSWPNKFLINVWGGFSVIFVASYTANIAALIAGLFFHNTATNYHDGLLSQRVGAPKASAAEYYIQRANKMVWEHMYKYSLDSIEDGLDRLRNGSLDIVIADTPILDYYRATDHGCKLQKIGDAINEDTYAIGMVKGFPLKDSISAVLAKYSSNGYMDILQEKWYGALPCFKLATEIAQPRPLGVAAVTGVFILLGVGVILGCIILLVEHLFFKYTLPLLRDKPKGSIWRSRNIMFFSQKLYRFINCVELVSPHHAARELVHTIRQGQITSLFQKSIKRKEHEQRRRRKSKAQFFEMIQEIRRQQQEEREFPLESLKEVEGENQLSPDDKKIKHSPSIIKRTFMRTSPKMDATTAKRSPTTYFNKQLFSPRSKNKAKSSTNLNVRRFSSDSVFNTQTLKADRSTAVGRRLSKDATSFLSSSPPDINSRRSSYLDIISTGGKLSGKSPVLSIENVSDCSAKSNETIRKLSDSESIGRKLATLPKYREPIDKQKLQPQYSLTIGKSDEALSRGQIEEQVVAKSCHNISDVGKDNLLPSPIDQKSNLSDDEIARRNKHTIEQLQQQMMASKPLIKPRRDNNSKHMNMNPQIRIEIEDTSKPRKHLKTRHQSLGDKTLPEPSKRSKTVEHSRSLDSNPQPRRDRSRSRSKHQEHGLPPAPPPPNCSPRNSNGRSPLERLSKDELVSLWKSSEMELRSHLLKAIRDKDQDPP